MIIFPQTIFVPAVWVSIVSSLLLITGCASSPPVDQVDLMPAPDVSVGRSLGTFSVISSPWPAVEGISLPLMKHVE